eukprot:UN28275
MTDLAEGEHLDALKKFRVRTVVSIIDGNNPVPYTTSSICGTPGYHKNVMHNSSRTGWEFPHKCMILNVKGKYSYPVQQLSSYMLTNHNNNKKTY